MYVPGNAKRTHDNYRTMERGIDAMGGIDAMHDLNRQTGDPDMAIKVVAIAVVGSVTAPIWLPAVGAGLIVYGAYRGVASTVNAVRNHLYSRRQYSGQTDEVRQEQNQQPDQPYEIRCCGTLLYSSAYQPNPTNL